MIYNLVCTLDQSKISTCVFLKQITPYFKLLEVTPSLVLSNKGEHLTAINISQR